MENKPEYKSKSFKCPHCFVNSQHKWLEKSNLEDIIKKIYQHFFYDYRGGLSNINEQPILKFLEFVNEKFSSKDIPFFSSDIAIANCQNCNDFSLWVDEELVYPKQIPVDPPNSDLNEDIQSLYNEAAEIVSDSPRGAAAILRLSLEKFLKQQIGLKGKTINDDIKKLVVEGLNPTIKESLDLLRVIGNSAVHPGQFDFNDNKNIAMQLFKILNKIAFELITNPQQIKKLHEDIIPDTKKEQIEQRDKN